MFWQSNATSGAMGAMLGMVMWDRLKIGYVRPRRDKGCVIAKKRTDEMRWGMKRDEKCRNEKRTFLQMYF